MFTGQFGSVLSELLAQTAQKYTDWFHLDLHILGIKPKSNQTHKQPVGLGQDILKNKCIEEIFENFVKYTKF
jgi:hypothetical protein